MPVRPGRRAREGRVFTISDELQAVIRETTDAGGRVVEFQFEGIFEEVLERVGEMPLPPYITKRLEDKERYQTVYAREKGSAAAPTAGLHFTPQLLKAVEDMGVPIVDVLLHVGLGTFRPVSVENVEDHHMHTEYYEVTPQAAATINQAEPMGAGSLPWAPPPAAPWKALQTRPGWYTAKQAGRAFLSPPVIGSRRWTP